MTGRIAARATSTPDADDSGDQPRDARHTVGPRPFRWAAGIRSRASKSSSHHLDERSVSTQQGLLDVRLAIKMGKGVVAEEHDIEGRRPYGERPEVGDQR